MEFIPYPGLPNLPKRLWKRRLSDEEKAAQRIKSKNYYEKNKAMFPPAERKAPQGTVAKRAKALASTAFCLAGKAAPACLTKDDKQAIENIYLQAVELSDKGAVHSVDHIYPLNGSRYGVSGLHVAANLAVMPLAENQCKGNRPHASWMDYET